MDLFLVKMRLLFYSLKNHNIYEHKNGFLKYSDYAYKSEALRRIIS